MFSVCKCSLEQKCTPRARGRDWGQTALFLPLACVALVPFSGPGLYCLSRGRGDPMRIHSFARLCKSHRNTGVQGQCTEHDHLGLSPAQFPLNALGRGQNCQLDAQPPRTDKHTEASAWPARVQAQAVDKGNSPLTYSIHLPCFRHQEAPRSHILLPGQE